MLRTKAALLFSIRESDIAMTEKRRLELEEKLNIAEARGDTAEIAAVKLTMEREYRECTSHTADRLKRVEATVNEIKEGLIPADLFEKLQNGQKELSKCFAEMRTEIEAWKNKAQGAKMLWRLLAILTAAGFGGVISKLMSASVQ